MAAPDADVDSALVTARRSGERVEVLPRGNEWERTWANPDGTLTLEQHLDAVRARRADGSWSPVDTTLRAVDGQVAPVAVVGEMSFSAGGFDPLVTIGQDGRRLSLSLPWRLPVPVVLRGPTATYRDVLPGVDLVLTA